MRRRQIAEQNYRKAEKNIRKISSWAQWSPVIAVRRCFFIVFGMAWVQKRKHIHCFNTDRGRLLTITWLPVEFAVAFSRLLFKHCSV